MNTYKTIDIARIIGIHVNTVRLYEKCGFRSVTKWSAEIDGVNQEFDVFEYIL